MNYIEQINWFWLLGGAHFSDGNETRLYFFLLKQSNSLYWKDTLANADGYIAAMVGISVNTLKTCRNRLQQAGLITFKTGGSGRAINAGTRSLMRVCREMMGGIKN